MFVGQRVQIRAAFADALRDSGFVVDEVTSIFEAVELAPRVRPDLVVLERELADGDGWDVARRLKASDQTRDTPIVALSLYTERGDVERALVAGCDAFVARPCEPDVLVRHVRGLLGMELEAARVKDVFYA